MPDEGIHTEYFLRNRGSNKKISMYFYADLADKIYESAYRDENTVSMWIREKLQEVVDKLFCGECDQYRPDDCRVKAGMKCGFCAYGSEGGQN